MSGILRASYIPTPAEIEARAADIRSGEVVISEASASVGVSLPMRGSGQRQAKPSGWISSYWPERWTTTRLQCQSG